MTKQIKEVVKKIVAMLVAHQYSDVESFTEGVRLSAEEIQAAISDYGRTLVGPPPDAWDLLDCIDIRNSTPPKWSIVMPLWTEEEGRSDLSLECTVIEAGTELKVELDDIHVL